MCLIAIAGKGTDKYSDLFLNGLRTSFKTNDDGIGFAFKRTKENASTGRNVAYYCKGLFKIEDVIEKLKKENLLPEDELIVHLRKISTGVRSASNCHPFLCSISEGLIDDCGPSYSVSPIVFHNGHFSDFKDPSNRKSDTYTFVQRFLRKDQIMNFLKADQEAFEEAFEPILKNNKLAILAPHHKEIIKIGDFIEDEGYFFSNLSYKDKRITNVGGRSGFIPDRTVNSGFDFSGFNTFKTHIENPSNSVLVDELNWDKIVLIANEDNKQLGYLKQQRFGIGTFNWNAPYQSVYLLVKPNIPIWITTEELYTNFDAFKKMSCMEMFDDFHIMKRVMVPISTTLIKKLEKVLEKNKYKADGTNVEVDYKNVVRSFTVGGIKMFLKDAKTKKEDPIIIPENPNKDRDLSEDEIQWREEQNKLGFTKEDKEFINKIVEKEKKQNSKNLTEEEVKKDILEKDKLADEFFQNHSN